MTLIVQQTKASECLLDTEHFDLIISLYLQNFKKYDLKDTEGYSIPSTELR